MFEAIEVQSIANVINDIFESSFDDFDEVSARHEILKRVYRIFSRLNLNIKNKVFFELFNKYDLYQVCNYSYRPMDYLMALGDIELLKCMRQIKFDFNESNDLGECPLETLILSNNIVAKTISAIKLLIREYDAQITQEVIDLMRDLEDPDDENDDVKVFLEEYQASVDSAKHRA